MIKEKHARKRDCSRRNFLAALAAAPALAASLPAAAADRVKLVSPGGKVGFWLEAPKSSRPAFGVTLKGRAVIEPSPVGIVVDGVDLGAGAEVVSVEHYRVRERYATRGVHSEAFDNCNGARVSLRHAASKTGYTLDARAYDDGVAFRLVVPGPTGARRVPDEATSFVVPSGSTVWFHDFGGHYEGIHARKGIADVKDGEWCAPPLTIKLPGGGYAAVTEGALINYAGLGLQADGRRGFRARLGHAHPVSHPFDLRYGKDEAKRLSEPAAIAGAITTPWRVVMVGADLGALINCDIVSHVSPPPDKTLFPAGPRTEWVRPGRAVWRYLDGGENTFEEMKEFSRLAGQLGFEHHVVEGFWRRWTEEQMRELADHSRRQGVSVWFWEHSRNLRTDEARASFFARLQRLGVAGAKIDFFDHEAKEVIDLYHSLLRSAAEHRVMVEFHGSNKPAGESRTWPNELSRESVRGMEYRSLQTRAVHNTTIPFTRLLAGHADYTPVHFGERRRETSWAHQIASAAVFTSPLQIYAAHPKTILEHPAVEMIKSIPSVWDETLVLPPSEIGELVVFARRAGPRWFLAILNGPAAKTVTAPLSFLGRGQHMALLVGDRPDEAAAVKIQNKVLTRADSLTVELRAGGGFIARFDDFDVAAFDRERVLKSAEQYLKERPVTVTASRSPRSAGGPHDFFSEGDYWWPDPQNPSGPYVQRDGQTNPDNFVEHRRALMRLSVQMPALAAAWKLTNDARYARHAARHLRAWFVDGRTRMNPSLLYAQAIKGRVTGRGIGIIDTIHLVEVARAVEVMEAGRALAPEDLAAVKRWFAGYLRWMTTHKYGIDEREAKNNHGTCWVMQVAACARLTGNGELLDYCRARFREVLVPNQMAADGSFPQELRRTKPYGYSLFNLDAMATIARLLSTPGDDLWKFELRDGRGMRRALEYMTPFIRDKKAWPLKPDVMYDREWPMRHCSLLFAGLALDRPDYVELWKRLPADSNVEEVVRNFFIRQPVLWVEDK